MRVLRFLILALVSLPAPAAMVRYIVVMDGPRHATVGPELRRRNIHINGEAHRLANAFFVAAEPADLARLRAIPGVRYVQREPRFRPTLDRAIQLVNVPAAWSALGGMTNAGLGIKIGIIDSGIEASHPAFQDPALTVPANYPQCSIATLPLAPLDCTQFTNNKILVARSYVPLVAAGYGSVPAANSRPDDYSPRDRVGHGTAVAMAAAGETNSGPSDTITGVAPKAFLGSYKVLGSPGVNDSTTGQAVMAALEDAYSDGMDIAVLSLGAPALSGPDDAGSICGLTAGTACDVFAAAVKNAATLGMLVVVAAGNNGQNGSSLPTTLGSITTPGDSPYALTVGASTNSHSWSNPLTVTGLGSFHALLGGGPAPNPALAAPLADVANVADPQGCNPVPAASLTGTYVLIQRGTCTFAAKVQNAQAGGAAGVVFTNNPGDDSVFSPGALAGVTTIPAALIAYDDGNAIRTYLQSNPTAAASMSTALQVYDVTTGNQIASFSSRGPVLASGAMKPDVVAAGTDLYLAGQNYDPNGELFSPIGYLTSQGTSFSTPQIAGIAALVKQAHPQLTTLQIKSAIVNTATQDVTDNGATASVLASGAGKASAAAAVATNLVASPSNASFGVVPASGLPLVQPIQLTNTGAVPMNLAVSIARRTAENSATTAIDRPSLLLAPGQTATVNLTLTGSLPNPGVYEGFVVVQGGAIPIQIPYLYVSGTGGVPANILPLIGATDDGNVGQSTSEGVIILQLLDQYGVPVPNAPVQFSVVSGGGSLQSPDTSTDIYGFAGAEVTLGPAPGANEFAATAGGLSTGFLATARLQPTISPKGVVDAASFTPGAAIAPGSYIAIFGTGLSDTTGVSSTPYLPVSIDNVSVSFDTASASYPGHIYFVTPGQVNVQVPWELQGQSSVRMKVSVQDSSGVLYTLPLAGYLPGIFQIPSGSANYAAARDENFNTITPANPAKQGHYIQIYCNGLGPVSNQPASGDPSPSNPLASTTAAPVVTIGGQTAQVQFSGLTPTTVGLYQINVLVPNVGSGVKPVTISTGGVTSQAANIPIQ